MTGVKLDYETDDKLRLLLENNMRGGPSFCMGNRYVKRGERKIVYEDMNNLYGWSMSQHKKNLICIHLIRKVSNLQNLFMLGLVF